MLSGKKVLVTGGSGFLGKHLLDALKEKAPDCILRAPRSKEYDLRKESDVSQLFSSFSPDIVIHLATTAKGMGYNKEHPGTLFYDHVMMNSMVLDASRKSGVEKFVAIGTALAYPGNAEIPIKEADIWKGYPESSLASLGLSSRMLLAQIQAYRSEFSFNAIYVILPNLYGPGDHFSSSQAHVIPVTIKKFDEAVKTQSGKVEIWGSGRASREFLYVKDAARGIIASLENYNKPEPLNIGPGQEVTIKNLAEKISSALNFSGEIFWDTSKPEGSLRRCLDSTRMFEETGFKPSTSFDEGLKATIDWYIKNRDAITKD